MSDRQHNYWTYIMASVSRVIYVGVTNDLERRVWEHKEKLVDGFTKKYGVHSLVYYEETDSIDSAIAREKQLKKWSRAWKIRLVEKVNPVWRDLYPDLL